MTNREKLMMNLQSMTDEELADMLAKILPCYGCPVGQQNCFSNIDHCDEVLQTWMKQEASK